MIICTNASALAGVLSHNENYSLQRGFVPTMGALHQGHISLISHAKKKCKNVIASIFVNPTQFNDPKDFEQYPITITEDILLLEAAGCDILYLPTAVELYPNGTQHLEQYELGSMELLLEGPYRPGHFQGVCQVMSRLLRKVQPGSLFMGSKDYQQCMVVQQLIAQLGLPIILHKCPTLREEDGLAMSSRNRRLSPEARKKATAIFNQLQHILNQTGTTAPRFLELQAAQNLLEAGFSHVDYVSIANPDTLEPIEEWNSATRLVVLCAAFIEGIRLIDNLSSH